MASRGRDPRTTKERGLGADHQRQRRRLLAAHVDGDPCPCRWWLSAGHDGACGALCPCRRAGRALPMFRDPSANVDGRPLDADHSLARVDGGQLADQLMIATCNRSSGAAAGNKRRGRLRHGDLVEPRRPRPPLPEW